MRGTIPVLALLVLAGCVVQGTSLKEHGLAGSLATVDAGMSPSPGESVCGEAFWQKTDGCSVYSRTESSGDLMVHTTPPLRVAACGTTISVCGNARLCKCIDASAELEVY